MKIASCAVVKTSGVPPAWGQSSASGTGIAWRSWTRRELGLPAAADDGHDAVALSKRVAPGPSRDDLAGELEPGDVLRRARRGGVHPGALHDVGAVEPGGPDADEDLAAARARVRVVLDDDLLVADRDGAHGAAVKHLGAAGAGPLATP